MDGVVLALRVLVALAVVVALVWYLARRVGGRVADRTRETEVRVVDRQSLSRHSGVAVVAAGDRRLLVGFGEAEVRLITELAPVPALVRTPEPATPAENPPATGAPRQRAGLAGSVLSPSTWQATVRAMQDRTVRR